MHDRSLFGRFDVNLLVTLDALLTERSVTLAARRLHVTQPAVSHSLARLRAHFDDPIFIRQGAGNVLTPLAERLSTLTTPALESMRDLFGAREGDAGAEGCRECVLCGSDSIAGTAKE